MKWKDLKIYQKLMVGFSAVLFLLVLISGGSVFNFNTLQQQSEQVSQKNREAAFMLAKEIDHLKWMAGVVIDQNSHLNTKFIRSQLKFFYYSSVVNK